MREFCILPSITNRESDALECYLREISALPQLTSEEEADLAVRIQNGDKAALDRLVSCNLRFVVSVAKRYPSVHLSLSDLINEGNVGLINAAQRFDPTRGFRFTTYAVWWVRQAIILAIISEGRIVSLPKRLQDAGLLVVQFSETFQQKHERMPTTEEIAEALNMQPTQVYLIQRSLENSVSIDTPLDDDGGNMLDILHAETTNADEQMANREFLADLANAIDSLPDREKEIIRMYFGIDGPELSLDEIGTRIGLRRERTRQLKDKAVDMLRTTQLKDAYRSYID